MRSNMTEQTCFRSPAQDTRVECIAVIYKVLSTFGSITRQYDCPNLGVGVVPGDTDLDSSLFIFTSWMPVSA